MIQAFSDRQEKERSDCLTTTDPPVRYNALLARSRLERRQGNLRNGRTFYAVRRQARPEQMERLEWKGQGADE
jgi:hypothetical protein